MDSALAAQLDFLTDASHILVATAPETSAYLMSRRTNLAVDNGLVLSDIQRQHICTSCGHILVPGRGSKLTFDAQKNPASQGKRRQRPKGRASITARSGAARVFSCESCGKDTKVTMPPPNPIARKKSPKDPVVRAAPAAVPAEKPSANASSKKRSKSRKAGLQALLLQHQAAAQQPSSLSLADFVRKGP